MTMLSPIASNLVKTMLVFAELRQVKIVFGTEDRTAAADVEQPLQRAGADVRIAAEYIDRRVLRIERYAVTGTVNRHLVRIFRRGHVLQVADVIAVEQVRMLHGEPRAKPRHPG